MANELADEVVEEVVEELEPNVDPSTPEEISLARKQGWRPQEEFKGDPTEFVSAHEYIERGKSWAHSLAKDAEALRGLIREQAEYNRQLRLRDAEKAKGEITNLERQVKELKALKVEAIKNNDGENAVKIDDQIDLIKDTITETKTEVARQAQTAQQPAPQVQATINSWKTKNTWYTTDARASRYANTVGDEYIQQHPGAQLDDVLTYVEKEVKQVFPQYGQQHAAPGGPDSGGTQRSGTRSMAQGTRQGTAKWESLDDQGKRLGEEFIEQGVFKNRQEYLDAYYDTDPNVPKALAKYKKNREATK